MDVHVGFMKVGSVPIFCVLGWPYIGLRDGDYEASVQPLDAVLGLGSIGIEVRV